MTDTKKTDSGALLIYARNNKTGEIVIGTSVPKGSKWEVIGTEPFADFMATVTTQIDVSLSGDYDVDPMKVAAPVGRTFLLTLLSTLAANFQGGTPEMTHAALVARCAGDERLAAHVAVRLTALKGITADRGIEIPEDIKLQVLAAAADAPCINGKFDPAEFARILQGEAYGPQ